MGNYFNLFGNSSEKSETSEIPFNITSIRRKIQELENSNEIQDINKKLELYQKILENDNTKENDVLNYLLLYLNLSKKVNNEDIFKRKLDTYGCCISEEKYQANFQNYRRTNSKKNIFNLLNLIAGDLDEDNNFIKRKNFINDILNRNDKEDSKSLKFTKKISWDNKELYLHNLYLFFLRTLTKKLKKFKKKDEGKNATNSGIYKYYKNLLDNEKDKMRKAEIIEYIKNINFFEGDFFNIYIKYFKEFLMSIKLVFENKFLENELASKEDQNMFENFIILIATYEFKGNEKRIISLWKADLCPLSREKKEKLIEQKNLLNEDDEYKISFELSNNKLIKKKAGIIIYEINDIDNYDFKTLLEDINKNVNDDFEYEYYLNKNLKVSLYNSKLFIIQKKDIWKQLIISILCSKAVKEAIKSVSKDIPMSLFNDQQLISDIIDSISFFIYDTNFSGITIENSLKIYEYGLFYCLSKSLSLSFYYSFNIVINIHEIGGHFNNRFQSFNSLENSFDSPEINYDQHLYSSYALEKKKESGESIEIALFGRRLRKLKIKEALFILDPLNYNIGIDDFKTNFNNCLNKEYKEIVNIASKETYLNRLGININDIPKEYNDYQTISNCVNLVNIDEFSIEALPNHFQEFYIDSSDLKFLRDTIEIINDWEKIKINNSN